MKKKGLFSHTGEIFPESYNLAMFQITLQDSKIANWSYQTAPKQGAGVV